MSDSSEPRIPGRRHAVPVRDPRNAPRGRGPRINPAHALVVALFCVFLVGAAAFIVMALAPSAGSPVGASGSAVVTPSSGSAVGSPAGSGSSDPGASELARSPGPQGTPGTPGPGETAAPSAAPGPVEDVAMPLVPVTSFWSTAVDISMNELTRALQGQSTRYPHVIVPTADRPAIGAALGITLGDAVESGDVEQIRQKTREGYLGLVRASDLSARVKAMTLGGKSLVGNDRIGKLSEWPLVATVRAPRSEEWDPRATWTIVAGGDMFLDRGVENTTLVKGKGVDYPFDGGTATVTGHYCCAPSSVKAEVPSYRRTGNAGLVREFLMAADLTIANLENPIPDNPSWHLNGLVFGGPPKLLAMFPRASIDWVSLANNHIYDYGSVGIAQTRANLKAAGIPFSGGGRDATQADEIVYLSTHGLKVAMVACVGVVKTSWASDTKAGGAPCKARYMLPRIEEARSNADVVIAFPHWGTEYDRNPLDKQRELARSWVAAGADIVLGSHSHVFGGLEDIDGHSILYSMGNFIFDQYWSTPTMESNLTEVTFQGTRVVQIALHPYIVLDQAQPNFLDPATDDGKALLGEVRKVSDSLGW